MAALANRIQNINDDFIDATEILLQLLDLGEAQSVAPELRVVLSNNIIVALVSTTEEALRDAFSEYLAIIEESGFSYGQLRSDLQKANLNSAISLLSEQRKLFDWTSTKSVVDTFAACLSQQDGYSLFREKITYNEGNFRSDQITTTAKRVGVRDIWLQICDSEDVENYTAEEIVESRVTRLVQDWNALFDERDIVVHRISQASGWSNESIRKGVNLSRLIFSRICSCLEVDAEALIARPR